MISHIINRPLRIFFVLILAAALSGCATYFERSAQKQCFSKDWSAEGFNTAKRGRLFHPSWEYQDKECKKYNIWSNQADFIEGYELGLEAFCAEHNGFEFGLRDRDYYPICGPNQQADFDAAFKDGQRLYQARAHLDSQEARLYETKDAIEYAREEREYLADEIDSGELDKATEKKYVKKRYRLKKRKQSAQYNLAGHQSDLRGAQLNESSLSERLYNRYYHGNKEVENGFSGDQSIVSENEVIHDPSILLYRPTKLAKENRRDLTEKINTLVRHVTSNHLRIFRFQVIGDTELSFIEKGGKATELQPSLRFGHTPTLIFWDTKQLSFESLGTNSELSLASLDSFIATQRLTLKLEPQFLSEFGFQSNLEKRPYRTEAEICRKANHQPGTIGAVECIGPILVE